MRRLLLDIWCFNFIQNCTLTNGWWRTALRKTIDESYLLHKSPCNLLHFKSTCLRKVALPRWSSKWYDCYTVVAEKYSDNSKRRFGNLKDRKYWNFLLHRKYKIYKVYKTTNFWMRSLLLNCCRDSCGFFTVIVHRYLNLFWTNIYIDQVSKTSIDCILSNEAA